MQRSLDINVCEEDFSKDSFRVSYCNLEAYRAINTEQWHNNKVLIMGEGGSGKSHLAKMWQNLVGAVYIVFGNDLFDSLYNRDAKAFICENIENIKDLDSEIRLFHLINFANDNNKKLLLTASHYPSFKLKDLKSRIAATYKVLIKQPDDSLLRIIIERHFSERQLRVNAEVIDYLIVRVERSFHAVKQIVEKIDRLSLAKKSNITIPLVKAVIENYQ